MIRLSISILLSWIICSLQLDAQDIRERVFVHPNAQVFVSGETFRFSAFTLSDQTGRVSELSQILYVQLVGKDGPVFEQKLSLQNGRGSGEFFVNSLIPTGRYQLLAYTRWMRNFGDYFQLPVTIVNPFETEIPEFDDDSLTQISFYHPNGFLIDGINTQVGFRITRPKANPSIKEGKIIDATGTVIHSFIPRDAGSGIFDFRPIAGELYRVLMEDERGNISFHEFIPIREDGYDLEVKRQTSNYVFIPRVAGRSVEDLVLEIYFANVLWDSRRVGIDEIQTISINSLPKEIFQVVLTESGKPVFSSSIIPAPLAISSQNIDGLKANFGKRDSLTLEIELPKGSYSVSIQKKMQNIKEPAIGSIQSRIWSTISDPLQSRFKTPDLNVEPYLLTSNFPFKIPDPIKDSVRLLPEVRNELVAATLQRTDGRPVSEVEVALAFPGVVPQVQTGFTNARGEVLFHHGLKSFDQQVYLSVLDHETGWQFEVEKKFLTAFPSFDYTLAPFDSLTALEIQERSIDNQILNAFHVQHNLSVDSSNLLLPQFTQWNFEYALDDYQRFPDFKEYFIEYIIGAGIRNGGIQIRKEYYRPSFQNHQLVLLDGVPVSPKRVLDLDPYLVENVRVMMNRFFLGPSVFDGVVLIETYENDLASYVPIAATKLDYQGISPNSTAFSGPELGLKRPDRRIHLYWNPVLDWQGGEFQLKSITSDVSGIFELRIEGFTTSGVPISIRKPFEVKP